jgi:hypothetical protein
LKTIQKLFNQKIKVLNVGVETFNDALTDQQASSTHVSWKPRAGGDAALIEKLDQLSSNPLVKAANQLALSKLKGAQPVWVDVLPAKEALKLDAYTLLHAGPPVAWNDMCVPMQGAVIAALKYEGLAKDDADAKTLAASGTIQFAPCHSRQAVGPMTGVISASMPVMVIKNITDGNFAYSTFNEGAGDVARFGAHTDNTIKRLRWIEETLAPLMKKTVLSAPQGINLKVLIAQALNMGDELHMRNNASTSIFLKAIIGKIVQASTDLKTLQTVSTFLTTNNDQFFLNFAMAAMKACTDAADGVPYSTLVTAMARNGVDIGIRVSGLPGRWFTAPAADVKGLYFPGFTVEDANKDIGDSAIMETGGAGGFAMAAGSAIVKFLGAGSYQDALNYTLEMYQITMGESPDFTIPNMEFRGTPLGIDVLKVVDTGILPVINTAIASRKAGGGMIGAGVARAPLPMFIEALKAFN